jgi:hypothetical protein
MNSISRLVKERYNISQCRFVAILIEEAVALISAAAALPTTKSVHELATPSGR